MKIKNPKTTCLIFSSGKAICLGAQSKEDAHFASKKFAKMIQRIIPEVRYSNFRVNMVMGK